MAGRLDNTLPVGDLRCCWLIH